MTSSPKTRVVDIERVHARNTGTCIAAPLRAGEFRYVAPETLRARWDEVLARIHTWREEHPEGSALAVVLRHNELFEIAVHQLVDSDDSVDDDDGVDAHAAASPGRPGAPPHGVVLGRHSNCDLVMQTSHASLRHAVVVAWPGARDAQDGGRVEAIDLRSELGLTTTDGRLARRITSSTALRFHAASDEVTALFAPHDEPFAVRWADQLEAQLSGALVDPDEVRVSRGRSDAWERSVVVRTRVAGMPPPVVREDQLAVATTRSSVEQGVVLGRYTRCDRTTALADDDRVSRVHALVFAARGKLWVVDTASTGGTSLVCADGSAIDVGEGHRIACMPHDARLFLAGVEAVLLLDP